jgi:hypothetical protein
VIGEEGFPRLSAGPWGFGRVNEIPSVPTLRFRAFAIRRESAVLPTAGWSLPFA